MASLADVQLERADGLSADVEASLASAEDVQMKAAPAVEVSEVAAEWTSVHPLHQGQQVVEQSADGEPQMIWNGLPKSTPAADLRWEFGQGSYE